MWKLSQFTVVKDLGERGLASHVLAYNTASHKCIVIPKNNWGALCNQLSRPTGEIPAPLRAALAKLVELGLVVTAERDEKAKWLADFNAVRYRQNRIFPLLAITTACNIGCTYCYEEGIEARTMTADVVRGCLQWMEQRIRCDRVSAINPGLFGGEPLLYPELLFAIMDGVADLRRRYGISAEFYSSTNGILLDHPLAAALAEKGLTQVQISLDGPPEIHDSRRMTKKGGATFKQSLRGLKIACDHIKNVTVKINFDRQNRSSTGRIIDVLDEAGIAQRVNVKLETIAYQMPDSRVIHDRAYVIPPESPELAEAYAELTLMCKERGIKVSRDTAHTTPCMFSSHHGVIIGPEGEIYKCISLVGRKEFIVGTVFQEDYVGDEYARQMDVGARVKDCFDDKCPYVPVCAAGCAFESIVRDGSYKERFCTRDNLDRHHYYQHLISHEKHLVSLGMQRLGSQELRAAPQHGVSDHRSRPVSATDNLTLRDFLPATACGGCNCG